MNSLKVSVSNAVATAFVLVLCAACTGTSVGNPAPKDRGVDCDIQETQVQGGDPFQATGLGGADGAGGAGGLTVDEIIAATSGVYESELEWMAEEEPHETTKLTVTVASRGPATLVTYGTPDTTWCDEPALGFSAEITVKTEDGGFDESGEATVGVSSDGSVGIGYVTTLEQLHGTLALDYSDMDPTSRVSFHMSVIAGKLQGSVSLDLGTHRVSEKVSASGQRRLAQFPVGGGS